MIDIFEKMSSFYNYFYYTKKINAMCGILFKKI